MIIKSKDHPVEMKEHMRDGNGTVKITKLVSPEELYNKGRLYANITLEPGCGIGHHVHENETEIFYIMQGNPIFEDNGQESVLSKGDVAVTSSGNGHSIRNETDETVEIIALIVLK